MLGVLFLGLCRYDDTNAPSEAAFRFHCDVEGSRDAVTSLVENVLLCRLLVTEYSPKPIALDLS